ncbi:HNH endonuclease [Staphylococcus aureus]
MDFTATYCAVDIYERFSTKSYTEQILNLLMSTNSMSQLNLNFRQLQNQYVKNENKRNTQLRINLKWLNDLYVSYIKSMNYYKYLILTENKDILAYSNYNSESTKFLERTVFYIENIINPNFSFELMSDKEKNRQVTSLREELNFSNQEKTLIDKSRNSKIITIANALLPEECVCCKDQYNIEDRTFKRRGTDKYYFELHHVISFGSNKSGDILENLVKLCPACHRALTPNRSESKYQKNLIKNILINSKSARDYVANFVSDPNDLNTKIEYVFSHLK